MVSEMIEAGKHYAASHGWNEDTRFYFHVYGHASVNSLHMHIVDYSKKARTASGRSLPAPLFTLRLCSSPSASRGPQGPTYDHLAYKGLTAADVLEVLKEELREAEEAERRKESETRHGEAEQPTRQQAKKQRAERGSEGKSSTCAIL